MSVRVDVLLWAQRITAKRSAPPHELLGIPAGSSIEEAQAAFHKIARMAHPDLHRNQLTADELKLVESAYATAAGAYAAFRSQTAMTQRLKKLEPIPMDDKTPAPGPPPAPPAPAAAPAAPAAPVRATPTPPPQAPPRPARPPTAPPPVTPAGPDPSANAAQSMSARALTYYRKAELALRRGDLRSAVLQIKMAIAADPSSQFLRAALAEVEAEIRKPQ